MSVKVTSTGIWLGSENGLFGLIGNEVIHISKSAPGSIIKSNFITEVSALSDGRLVFVAYGDGIYTLWPGIAEPQRLKIVPDTLHARAWSLKVRNKIIFINTGSDITAFNLESGKQVSALSEILEGRNRNIISFDVHKEKLWWIEERKGVFAYNKLTKRLVSYSIEEFFPAVSKLTALYAEEDNLFIGSDLGLHRIDLKSNHISHVTARPSDIGIEQNEPVYEIKRAPNGRLWVAAERLFTVDEDRELLQLPTHLFPSFQTAFVEIVWRFSFDEQSNLYGADTQRGLFVIPEYATDLQILNHNKIIETGLVNDIAFKNETSFWYTSPKAVTIYDSSSNSSKRITLPTTKKTWILSMFPEGVDVIDEDGNVYSVSLRTLGVLGKENIFAKSQINGVVTDTALSENGSFLVVNSKQGNNLYRFQHGKALPLPFVSEVSLLSNNNLEGPIYVGVVGQGGYHAEINADKEVVFKKAFEGLDWNTACIHIYPNEQVWTCSAEGALLKIAEKDSQYDNAILKESVVRGIGSISGSELLVATNTGLFYVDSKKDITVPLDRTFGISDNDFEYDAIRSTSSISTVYGDRFIYIINHNSLRESIKEYLNHSSPVHIFSAISINKKEESKKTHLSETSLFSEGTTKMEVESDKDSIVFRLGVANYLDYESLKIQYRMHGIDGQWVSLDSNESEVIFSDLSPGEHIFQSRTVLEVSNRPNPINSLIIHVAPPWWLTLYAFICYILIFIVVLSFGIRALKKRLNAQSEALSGKVDEQRHELTHTQTYIKTLLSRKHQVFLKVAREVQTPLALILGPLQYIKENPNDTGNGQRINVMARNAKRLHLLINQMTEIEQLEQSKKRKKQTYQIRQHIPRLLANLEPVISQKNICLSTRLRATGAITLLSGSLEKIFYSLVTSVLERCTEGTEIALHTRCEALHLVIQIRDSEPAMSEEEQASIFDNVASYGDKTEGDWSPKLSLVREATLANAGWFGLDSDPVKGNCFSVYLPLINLSEGLSASAPAVTEVLPKLPRVETNRPVVLIVEDNPDMRQYLADALKSDYNCLESTDGKHALQVMAAVPTCLVISDTNMPYCDGYQLISAMKADSRFNHIPFLLISEVPSTNIMQKCVDLGIDNVLVKPVDIGELRYTVHNLVGRHARSSHEKNSVNALSPFAIPEFENARDQAFYTRFINLLAAHYQEEGFGKLEAASALAMSDRQLSRKLRAIFAMSFSETLKEYRIHRAKIMLSQGHQVTEVAYEVGFNTTSYFSRSFKASCNETPSQYQDRIAEAPAS
ncbi:helix-turn-helix domain-containing protein [Salinimonas chungwhensis]|uniref:helix-turn-helix domain-containing protein n=1 Tax=Salinimonas chungwhensis TaxID=265425 RepID=UPI0014612EBA|nr:helix-turn-helix domain-containing protein [Salinimonas chungwhensis]